jgi:pyruvate/2-oxoglutarate dehydrogenase complex dihydrolipoamide dehydrogenase (E3) component
MYDLVVLGGGTAGLVCAAGAAGLGAQGALVERASLGGDCLNTGCVPSKALIRAARAVRDARVSADLGVTTTTRVEFTDVMRSVRKRRADLAHHDSASRLSSLGVHVFFGAASFTGPRTVLVNRRKLRFRRAVIATGSRPSVPSVPGLVDVRCLTSENLFEITDQPRALLVVGGGPIGCEMAQAFALLGTAVTIVEAGPRVLPREDTEAAGLVARQLAADGVRVLTKTSLRQISDSGGQITATFDAGSISADTILVAIGRSANLEGLNLESALVRLGPDGLAVDDHLRTSNHRVYAAGDVCSSLKFTHAADAMARVVIQNALFHGRRRVSALVIPWCTYTSPELAHVGISPAEAARRGAVPITINFADVDRSVIDDESDGFLRVHHDRGRILAATIVGARTPPSSSGTSRRRCAGAADWATWPTTSFRTRRWPTRCAKLAMPTGARV